jgi:hypothetical protein
MIAIDPPVRILIFSLASEGPSTHAPRRWMLVHRCGRAVHRPTSGGDRSGTPLIPSRVLAPLHPGFQGRDVSGVDDNEAPATPQPELGNPPEATGHPGDFAEPAVRHFADGRAIVP